MKEFSLEEARQYVADKGKKALVFFVNVYGWSVYYTLESTFATPTGVLKSFPRTKRIWAV